MIREATLFEIGTGRDQESQMERRRRLARERQRTWRQRNSQFCVPIIESPTPAVTYTTCGEGTR